MQIAPTLSRRLARWLLELEASQVSHSRLHRVRIVLLDFLACVYGAAHLPETRTAQALGKTGPFQVPGQTQTMDLGSACIAWGMTGALLQWHDGYGRGGNHPSSSILPVLLAQSQDWPALLMPVLVGYETANRLATLTHPGQTLAGSAPTSSMGAVGAAAALCRWQELDEITTARALGIAGFAAPVAAFEGLRARGSAVPLHSGLAARAGLEAVQLAQAGYEASEHLFEGHGGAGLLNFLGVGADAVAAIDPSSWRGETFDQVYLKPFPGCRHVHPAVEAALGLRSQLPADPDRWRRIEITSYDLAVSFGAIPRPQAELYDCLMSLPWCVALALLQGAPDVAAVSQGRDRADLWSLCQRISVGPDSAHQAAYPAKLGATLTVVDDQGQVYRQSAELLYASAADTYSPAGPFGPVLNEQGVVDKFLRLTHAFMSRSQRQDLVSAILDAQPGGRRWRAPPASPASPAPP
jgi:2-methylcitrate dehydratase PrpD